MKRMIARVPSKHNASPSEILIKSSTEALGTDYKCSKHSAETWGQFVSTCLQTKFRYFTVLAISSGLCQQDQHFILHISTRFEQIIRERSTLNVRGDVVHVNTLRT